MTAADPSHKPASISHDSFALPFAWPMLAIAQLAEKGLELSIKNLKFMGEERKINLDLKPKLANPSVPALDLRTMVLRDYSIPDAQGLPTLVDAPYAGHTAMIADFAPNQSLMETLRESGIGRLYLTDWKSATPDMKDLEIDQYLAELLAVIDELGGRVNLVGLCQGGWMATMLAARYPTKVASLVLAGSPIDTNAGNGPIKDMAHTLPTAFYTELVEAGGGLMRGAFMLQGWKNMHPEQHYIQKHIDLYEHMDDPAWLKKTEIFESWYENPINLPGRWYLQAIEKIFKNNLLAKDEFIALGRRLKLCDITCPTFLLAGEADDITTAEQVFAAEHLFGTPKDMIVKRLVPGGHIGLFMGSHTLKTFWPEIGRWITTVSS